MNRHRALLNIVGTGLILVALGALSACTSTPTPTVSSRLELGVNSLNGPVVENGIAEEATELHASRDRWAVQWFWVEQPWREDNDPVWMQDLTGHFNSTLSISSSVTQDIHQAM